MSIYQLDAGASKYITISFFCPVCSLCLGQVKGMQVIFILGV